jgi:hypothetical protein
VISFLSSTLNTLALFNDNAPQVFSFSRQPLLDLLLNLLCDPPIEKC